MRALTDASVGRTRDRGGHPHRHAEVHMTTTVKNRSGQNNGWGVWSLGRFGTVGSMKKKKMNERAERVSTGVRDEIRRCECGHLEDVHRPAGHERTLWGVPTCEGCYSWIQDNGGDDWFLMLLPAAHEFQEDE